MGIFTEFGWIVQNNIDISMDSLISNLDTYILGTNNFDSLDGTENNLANFDYGDGTSSPEETESPNLAPEGTIVGINDIRTIDGTDNQIDENGVSLGGERDNGNQGAELVRVFEPAFEDGINEPRGGGLTTPESSLPNARTISNALADQGDLLGNSLGVSDWIWQWGQFIDHDLSLSEGANLFTLTPEEVADAQFNISLVEDDILVGANFTSIPVNRIPAAEGTGEGDVPREIENEITAFIDGSNIYGSEGERAAEIRTDLGNSFFGIYAEGEEGEALPVPPGESPYDGKLIDSDTSYGTDGILFDTPGGDPNNTSGETLLPYNRTSLSNGDPDPDPEGEGRVPDDQEFLAGEIRSGEQVGLTAVHTLLVREHNRIADLVAERLDAGDDEALNEAFADFRDVYVPSLELEEEPSEAAIRGEFIYEAARALAGATNQVITYEEFLPILVGNESASDLEAIDEELLSPGVSAEFSVAAFRLGHTLLSEQIRTIDQGGVGSISLRDAFFSPGIVSANGVDNILLGLNYQESNEVDTRVIDGVRNNLFGPPGAGGLDLAAINIQRGREVGIPGYVEIYNQLNPDSPIESFDDLDPIFGAELAAEFEGVYDSVDQIDLWIGGLAEISDENVLLGPTLGAIVSDQFARLRDFDRFFYETQLEDPDSFLSVVSNAIGSNIGDVRLADVIRNNVDNPELVPDSAFFVPFDNEITGTVTGNRGENPIVGEAGNDLIDGLSGNDLIFGADGDDLIFGGDGNDTLNGQNGVDTLVGGEGEDFLIGAGGDALSGGAGNDTYQVDVNSAGSEINDSAGIDNLLLTDNGQYVFVTLGQSTEDAIGISQLGNDLIIDLDSNGVVDESQDLKVRNFFDGVQAGSGFIETVNNISGVEIIDYFAPNLDQGKSIVHQFFRSDLDTYFHTTSEIEKEFIVNNLPNFVYEGGLFNSASDSTNNDSVSGAKPVYRFLNSDTGTHFYTISEVEKDYVTDNLTNYDFESVAYHAYDTAQEDTTELYRLYNTESDFHLYTTSATERDSLLEDQLGFISEGEQGIAFYVQSFGDATS